VRRRLDTELVRRGLATSRESARLLVEQGAVLVGGSRADKAARLVAESDPVVVVDTGSRPFVSRGGQKLDAALDRFAVVVAGRRCLDAGASTGGFTDCLLRRGASKVVAVDVGHGQLDASLRGDSRVEVRERTNIRTLGPGDVGGELFDLLVADLSFISLVSVAPVLVGSLARPGADVVVLVKPQFEAGRVEVSRGKGVIRDPAVRRGALEKVASAFASQGASIMGAMASPLLGPAGNAEFLLHVRAGAAPGAISAPISPPTGAGWAQLLEDAVGEAPDAAGTARGPESEGTPGPVAPSPEGR
jgi:23S rRNA (cytidine1920-2'-O)/16S rRNA (cytidine1409-2'-O)-methyltransferase